MSGWKLSHESIPKNYDPNAQEPKWEEFWLSKEVYERVYKLKRDGRPIFFIDTPPPFTSGDLHVGQGYWVSIADTIARYKRMRGYDVLIPQGWDTHGLPTELKVENKLGISRNNRELFEKSCVEWTLKMISIMKADMIRLGYRPDWEGFEYSTHTESYLKAVQLSLIDMYEKGYVYLDTFPVIWCPKCETAIAQAETGYQEEDGFLYTVKFELEESGCISIATTRPELIPACQAIAVNPKDERYTRFVGKKVRVPYTQKSVPIIQDEDVDKEFGTGAVMVCSYGDEMDIKWIKRHALGSEQIIDEKGRFTKPEFLYGKSVKSARETIVQKLKNDGLLLDERAIKHKVLIHAERSDCRSPLEFLEKTQVMIRLKQSLDKIREIADNMLFYPEFMRNKLKDWLSSIEWDWIVSRQRVFGTPLPFYHCKACNALLPVPKELLPFDPRKQPPPFNKCVNCSSYDLEPLTDVCDGWIDSSITPLFVAGYFNGDKALFEQAYPASIRLQGQEIIRTWLFYTIFRCNAIAGKPPFKAAVVHGWVLDLEGRKMSKSLGGAALVRQVISQYGADSLRYTLLTFPIGFDFEYAHELVRKGKLFMQKIWSAYRFTAPYVRDVSDNIELSPVDHWILSELKTTIESVTRSFDRYEFSEGLSKFYDFFWHDFCDEYLEAIKFRLASEKQDDAAVYTLNKVAWCALRLLAPVMPHLAEEIYQRFFKRTLISIHEATWPDPQEVRFDQKSAELGEMTIKVIKEARRVKVAQRIPLSQPLNKLMVSLPPDLEEVKTQKHVIKAVIRANEVEFSDGKELSVEIKV